jgi:5-(carboxyamino)imidazole ribonucleotide synthase
MHVGIIGCGQLARMLALAGWHMGLRFSFLADERESTGCVDGLGAVVRWSGEEAPAEIFLALGKPDVVTVERELVDADLLAGLAEFCRVCPGADAVRMCQHRLREKQLLSSLGIDNAPYRHASNAAELRQAVDDLGYPLVIKTCSGGYDGKGQWRFNTPGDLESFCGQHAEGDWLVERKIDFDAEISVIGVRSATGEVAVYPPAENLHRDGILLTSITPPRELSDATRDACHDYIQSLLESLDYVGVLAVECFACGDRLLVNELAPRVHNSGHWTMLSEATSQFENHLRALLGLPLGTTRTHRHAGMINILGRNDQAENLQALSQDCALHLYNKPAAPARKLGHFNVLCDTREALLAELGRLHRVIYRQDEFPLEDTSSGGRGAHQAERPRF